ncbi:putative disease resistance RPP13-like protein 1 [Humulus lupulus]|uniref:putative disease resistance RPP13-like protein 1 n=1 Tax=Humulus lupulus TaxID=3486 RepID=UPI002B40EAC3|nr:putative disease resistance RPP13-like protein 1 [Humulus lupulus]
MFCYCSLFPKDYMFTQKEIIFLWMAEGLLRSKKEKGIEEVGEEYFQELISKSFFQPSSENKSTFLMHELIHELAMFVSGEFCSVLNENKLSLKVRHLSCMRDCGGIFYSKEFEEQLSQAKCLRTFLLKLQWIGLDRVWLSIIEQLHEAFPRLRVLSIANHYVNKLPDSIGSLKYLRYLELECCEMKKIPDTICNLYNLETLILSECGQVTRLPTNIGNLFKLQHLHIPPYLEEMPLQISKMKNLQTLNRFVVGKNEFVITLLEGLQDLRGTLRLFGLENVDSVEDVLEAKLKNKKFLSQLHLFWAKTHKPHDSEREKEILSALEPHASLKAFTIRGYRGNSFPNWIGNHSNVVRVNLWHCETCSFLPPLGQLPSLKDLAIRGLYGVVKISSEFYYSTGADSSLGTKTKPFRYLESLSFEDMRELQEWSFIEKLGFESCEKLKVSLLPNYFPSLRELVIDECEQLMPFLPVAQPTEASFPPLEILQIKGCDGQESLLERGLPWSLKYIEIVSCRNLKALDEEAFQHLTSLEKLQIEYCGMLQYLPKELPTSLSDLCIRHCTTNLYIDKNHGAPPKNKLLTYLFGSQVSFRTMWILCGLAHSFWIRMDQMSAKELTLDTMTRIMRLHLKTNWFWLTFDSWSPEEPIILSGDHLVPSRTLLNDDFNFFLIISSDVM